MLHTRNLKHQNSPYELACTRTLLWNAWKTNLVLLMVVLLGLTGNAEWVVLFEDNDLLFMRYVSLDKALVYQIRKHAFHLCGRAYASKPRHANVQRHLFEAEERGQCPAGARI